MLAAYLHTKTQSKLKKIYSNHVLIKNTLSISDPFIRKSMWFGHVKIHCKNNTSKLW